MERLKLSLKTRILIKLRLIWRVIKGDSVMYRMEIVGDGAYAVPLENESIICENIFPAAIIGFRERNELF